MAQWMLAFSYMGIHLLEYFVTLALKDLDVGLFLLESLFATVLVFYLLQDIAMEIFEYLLDLLLLVFVPLFYLLDGELFGMFGLHCY
jgi:hypothetical protein